MSILKSAHRAFSLSLEGVRETISALAERVTLRVQAGKLQFRAEETEARLRHAYESLGACLHRTRTAPYAGAFPADEVHQLCERIHTEQRTLQELRDKLASHDDDSLVVPLVRLQEDLRESGGTVERVTISPTAHADGKRLSELVFPEGVHVVAIRRDDALIFPTETVVLRAGDQVTLVGNRSVIPSALQSLRT